MAETKLSDLFDFCPVCGSGKSQRHEYDCEFVKFESELARTKRALEMARGGLRNVEELSRGMNMQGTIATNTLLAIRKETGE